MSKLLDYQRQIAELMTLAEAARTEELEEQLADMKARIEAYGIRPDQLFSKEALAGEAPKPKRVRLPAKFALNGHTWSGKGSPPNWYREALRNGKTPEQMLIHQPS